MISPLHNRKGFTLVELIITMGLMSILLMGAVTVFMTASESFVSAQVRNRQQLLLDGMVETISTELRYATEVTINGDDTTRASIYASNGNLYMVPQTGSSPAITTDGYDLVLNFEKSGDYTLLLDISLTDSTGEITTETSTAIRLINCEVQDDPPAPLKGSNSGPSISYLAVQ